MTKDLPVYTEEEIRPQRPQLWSMNHHLRPKRNSNPNQLLLSQWIDHPIKMLSLPAPSTSLSADLDLAWPMKLLLLRIWTKRRMTMSSQGTKICLNTHLECISLSSSAVSNSSKSHLPNPNQAEFRASLTLERNLRMPDLTRNIKKEVITDRLLIWILAKSQCRQREWLEAKLLPKLSLLLK